MKNICLCILTALLFSCGSDDLLEQEQIDLYVMENNLTPEETSEGLLYVISDPGSEEMPTISSTINIGYEGYYVDGEVFDSNADFSFPMENLIQGWQIGVPLIGKGGSIKLIVPPRLGYGPNPQNGIRSNAVLVFDIDLFDFD